MKKKLLLIFLALIGIFACALCIAACKKEEDKYYGIKLINDSYAGGTIDDYNSSGHKVGGDVTVSATTNQGYTFIGWYDEEDTKVSSELVYTFVMPERQVTLTAKWIKISVVSDDKEMGTVTELTDTYIAGDEITITAESTNENKFAFSGWYDGETKLTSNASYTFVMPDEPRTYTAVWEFVLDMSAFKYTLKSGKLTVTGLQDKDATNVVIPAGVDAIGSYAFEGCANLKSIVIPDGVTSIGNHAFEGCASLESVVIPDGVTSIGYDAFKDCTSLESIELANSITSLGSSLFSGCSSLSGVSIPDGVDYIPSYMFLYCNSLTSIELPSSVDNIGRSAFTGCSGLTNIYYTGDITDWCGVSGISEILSSGRTLYIDGTELKGELIIPDDVTSIADYAFYYCTGITSVTIPDSVTTIGNNAFSGCSGLISATIPSFAARYVSSSYLKTVVITSGDSIGSYAFSGCSSLTSVTIPNNITSIGASAFYNCSSLSNITIPDSVTSVGSGAFSWCDALSSVTAPAVAISYIPLTNLKTVVITSGESIGSYAFRDCNTLTSVTIANSITSIGRYAFYACSSLTSINIPNSLTEISDYTFAKCSNLVTIKIPNSVTTIGNLAFSNCSNLASVTIGTGVTSIGQAVFADCSKIKSLILPDGLTSIGSSAFRDNTSLTKISIPDSITSIGDTAFSGCTSLNYNVYSNAEYLGNDNNSYVVLIKAVNTGISSCTIYEKTKIIYVSAFSGCTNYKSINIPESVVFIGENAFKDIYRFSFYYMGDLAEWCNITFGDFSELVHYLYIKNELVTTAIIPDGVTYISDYAFCYCGITDVVIPSSVTKIGKCAFGCCFALKSVTFGKEVTSLGFSAFGGNSTITDVYYSGSEEDWENNIKDINSLTSLTKATIHYNC